MKATSLTAERLRQVLHYDPETGVFTWKVKTCRKVVPGVVAGRVNNQGQRYIGVLGHSHTAQCLAWLYTHGEWPKEPVVHVNYRSDDNRIVNLRLSGRHDQTSPISAETLRESLDYDPETGVFIWKVNHGKCVPGERAGSLNNFHGYESIGVAGRRLLSHRLAWLYVYGEWPEDQIDHINRVRSDNRITNLRLATCSENLQNTKLRLDNKSGHKGVIWFRRDSVWRAYITVNRVSQHLGYFPQINDAIAARKAAEAKYHPFAPKEAAHA